MVDVFAMCNFTMYFLYGYATFSDGALLTSTLPTPKILPLFELTLARFGPSNAIEAEEYLAATSSLPSKSS